MRVKWNDWAKVRDLLGLRVMNVIHGDGAETTIVVDGPEHALRSLTMSGRTARNGNKLALILAEMVNKAEAHTGSIQRQELRGGLRIDMMLGIDGTLRLQASRAKVEPSVKEWETTLKHLPEGLSAQNEQRMEHQGRFFVRCELT